MTAPLDDVAFLARSGHRVDVLRTLVSEPRTRADLHDETGISQPTLGRILGDFEDRNWVERHGHGYALTAAGALVADAFDDLLDTVEIVQNLGAVIQLLPTEEMDFDIRAFADATVTSPEPGEALTHVTRLAELLYQTDHIRVLTPTIAPGPEEDRRQRAAAFLDSDRVSEGIVSAEAMQREPLFDVGDEASLGFLRTALESGRVRLHVYDGPIPLLLMVADGTAVLAPTDEHDTPVVVIESTNETVRSWVDAQLDAYRERATELTTEDLPV
ncbi:helix-turn-helix transcriptional regulator [Halorarius litoreus]|uniref:helix-turn-helix transcriptional regulator n=1 Tax=Halorarius litoreus TaxID=2962676 RepID=UPI0020CC44CA|nr:hypothetical protein [Halorarius litoreus]